jgi:hypothetical protein
MAVPWRAWKETMRRGRSGKRGSYQEFWEDEAELVARFDWSRCTESSAIACQSFVWRQQDPLAVASVALVLKQI